MEYFIIKETYLRELAKTVNTYMKDGWEPLGGPQIGERDTTDPLVTPATNRQRFYIQAMLKREATTQIPVEALR